MIGNGLADTHCPLAQRNVIDPAQDKPPPFDPKPSSQASAYRTVGIGIGDIPTVAYRDRLRAALICSPAGSERMRRSVSLGAKEPPKTQAKPSRRFLPWNLGAVGAQASDSRSTKSRWRRARLNRQCPGSATSIPRLADRFHVIAPRRRATSYRAGRSAIAPSPSRARAISAAAQKAGYSHPPPLFENTQPLAPCTKTIVPNISSARTGATHRT